MLLYHFLYVSYFQLTNMVDKYMAYDSVNFSNNKWEIMNRFRLTVFWFLGKGSGSQLESCFNETRVSDVMESNKKNMHIHRINQKSWLYLEQFLVADKTICLNEVWYLIY